MKLPPIEKIAEALSVIKDNRIKLFNTYAEITSSSNEKIYTVKFNENNYSSNDSTTYWRGYAGYPIIAVLMKQNKLTYNSELLLYFNNINWTELNKKHKRNYELALNEIYSNLKLESKEVEYINNELLKIYNDLKELDLEIKRNSEKPRKVG